MSYHLIYRFNMLLAVNILTYLSYLVIFQLALFVVLERFYFQMVN